MQKPLKLKNVHSQTLILLMIQWKETFKDIQKYYYLENDTENAMLNNNSEYENEVHLLHKKSEWILLLLKEQAMQDCVYCSDDTVTMTQSTLDNCQCVQGIIIICRLYKLFRSRADHALNHHHEHNGNQLTINNLFVMLMPYNDIDLINDFNHVLSRHFRKAKESNGNTHRDHNHNNHMNDNMYNDMLCTLSASESEESNVSETESKAV